MENQRSFGNKAPWYSPAKVMTKSSSSMAYIWWLPFHVIWKQGRFFLVIDLLRKEILCNGERTNKQVSCVSSSQQHSKLMKPCRLCDGNASPSKSCTRMAGPDMNRTPCCVTLATCTYTAARMIKPCRVLKASCCSTLIESSSWRLGGEAALLNGKGDEQERETLVCSGGSFRSCIVWVSCSVSVSSVNVSYIGWKCHHHNNYANSRFCSVLFGRPHQKAHWASIRIALTPLQYPIPQSIGRMSFTRTHTARCKCMIDITGTYLSKLFGTGKKS